MTTPTPPSSKIKKTPPTVAPKPKGLIARARHKVQKKWHNRKNPPPTAPPASAFYPEFKKTSEEDEHSRRQRVLADLVKSSKCEVLDALKVHAVEAKKVAEKQAKLTNVIIDLGTQSAKEFKKMNDTIFEMHQQLETQSKQIILLRDTCILARKERRDTILVQKWIAEHPHKALFWAWFGTNSSGPRMDMKIGNRPSSLRAWHRSTKKGATSPRRLTDSLRRAGQKTSDRFLKIVAPAYDPNRILNTEDDLNTGDDVYETKV